MSSTVISCPVHDTDATRGPARRVPSLARRTAYRYSVVEERLSALGKSFGTVQRRELIYRDGTHVRRVYYEDRVRPAKRNYCEDRGRDLFSRLFRDGVRPRGKRGFSWILVG